MRKWISLAVLGIILLVFGYAIYKNQEQFAVILEVSWQDFALLVFFTFIFIFSQGLILLTTARFFGITLAFYEWFGLLIVTFFTNYLIPFLGFGVRAAYLKKQHNLSYTDFTASLLGILIVEFTVYATAALVGLGYLYVNFGVVDLPLTALMIFIVTGFFVSLFWNPDWIPFRHQSTEKLRQGMRYWHRFMRDPTVIIGLFVWTTVQLFAFAGAFWTAYHAIGLNIPYVASFITAALSDFSFLIRIAPAAAGSFEAAVYYASLYYELTFVQSLVIATLVRIALAIIFIPLGPPFMYFLMKKMDIR